MTQLSRQMGQLSTHFPAQFSYEQEVASASPPPSLHSGQSNPFTLTGEAHIPTSGKFLFQWSLVFQQPSTYTSDTSLSCSVYSSEKLPSGSSALHKCRNAMHPLTEPTWTQSYSGQEVLSNIHKVRSHHFLAQMNPCNWAAPI